MQQQPFNPRQMFQLKPKTLEKRISAYYAVSGNQENVIKLVRVLQIHPVLGREEHSKPCDKWILKLYLNGASSFCAYLWSCQDCGGCIN